MQPILCMFSSSFGPITFALAFVRDLRWFTIDSLLLLFFSLGWH